MSEITNHPPDLTPLDDYPGFAIRPNGDVWRLAPTGRGRFAGAEPRKLVPVIHPKGHSWAVFVTDWEGRRRRVKVSGLLRKTFGVDSPVLNA
jgi:hypothetical protein